MAHGGLSEETTAAKSILASGQSRHSQTIELLSVDVIFMKLQSTIKRPKGFRLNVRKLGQPSVKLSDAEKENLSEVLDVLLKYSNINKDSKCPHIEGKMI